MEYTKGFWNFAWNYFCNLWSKKISELKELNEYNNYIKN